ncbi:Small secreted domain (DUF320) [Mycobacterium tuberculosis]|nr:Small secreted domain (DUF320) [Mycobacterium tuberculosis]
MRKWAKSTSRAALVAAGALAMGAAFGSGAAASAGTGYGGGHDGKVELQSAGNFGIGNGNQVYAPISIPIDVCGNAVAIAGLAQAQCKGGAEVSSHRSHDGYAAGPGYRTAGARDGGDGWDGGGWGHGKSVDMKSSGNFGIGNGNQVYAPISIPVDVCGNSVAAFGLARAQCKGGASVKRSGDRDVDMKTSGNFGALNGNQAFIPISIPINVCGNAVAALGLAEAQCKGGAGVTDGGHEPPPVLRTPEHKPYKPSKHRPAGKHKKLPSTLRADGRRMADTGRSYRTADGLPAVQQLLNTVGGVANLRGVNLRSAQGGAGAPVRVGSPVLS